MDVSSEELRVGAARLVAAGFDPAALAHLPSAEELASDELVVDPKDPDFGAPAITNQWSSLVALREPFAYAGLSSPEIYHAGNQAELYISLAGVEAGRPVPATEAFERIGYRWYPSRIARVGEYQGLRFEVVTCLSVTAQVVINRLRLTNTTAVALAPRLTLVVHADIDSRWDVVFPLEDMLKGALKRDGKRVLASGPGGDAFALMGADLEPRSISGLPAGENAWQAFLAGQSVGEELDGHQHALLDYKLEVAPGETLTFDWLHALGPDPLSATLAYESHAADVSGALAAVRDGWEREWRAAFAPADEPGGRFSGHAAVVTSDNPKLERLYYLGLMTLLQCKRTRRFGDPAEVYITGFPTSVFTFANNWVFPWDTKMVSGILAMLDPLVLKRMITAWLEADLHQGCAIDFTSGRPVGFWYAVNDYALIHMAWQYLRYTGDDAFLDQVVRGKDVLSHLEDAALYYQRIAGEDGLADYGGAENLLECVSTYTHKVASFNAANVWNLRTVAELFTARGQSDRAARLRTLADALVPAVQGLYVPVEGVWSCLQPDGSKNVVRHCLDFHAVAQCLKNDLSAQQRREMVAFFLRELKTETWMHALSPLDPDTAFSSRTDHQDEGAYTTWPAYAFEVLMQEGFEEEALAWLGDDGRPGFADVTRQGAFGQAYTHGDEGSPRLAGAGAKGPMEMPHIEKPTLLSGGKYAQIVIEAVGGLDPRPLGGLALVERRLPTRLVARNLWLRGANHRLEVAGG